MAALNPFLSVRPVTPEFDPLLQTRPPGIPAIAYDQFQAQPQFSDIIDRILGYRTDWACDFPSKGTWAECYSSIGNIIEKRGNDNRRLVLGVPTCLNTRGTGYESESFQNVAVGTGIYSSVLDGGLDNVWIRIASAGRKPSLRDLICRMDWEHTGSYFPWFPGRPTVAATMEACRQSRLARRYIVDRIKCPTFDPNGKGANPHAAFAAGIEFFFNPECGGSLNVPAEQTWVGTVRFTGRGDSAAAAPAGGAGFASIGLRNDWYTWQDTRTSPATITVYKKVGTTELDAVWTVQPGLTAPVIPFPDGVSPYRDANGNQYLYAKYVGSEAYASNYDMFNNTPELLFMNRTLGIVDRELKFGQFTIPGGFREHAIKEGVGYWLQFAIDRGLVWVVGEWGAGMKIDFPGGGSMDVSGMGAIYDNPHHINWMVAGMIQYGALFNILWDHNVSDFLAGFSETWRLTGIIPKDPKSTKELMGAAILRAFGKPGLKIRDYDESNVPCGPINVQWLPGFEGGNIPAGTPVATPVAITTEGANAKRVCWCSFGVQDGNEGTGYGPLAYRDGLLSDGSTDNVLRYRVTQTPGVKKLWLQAGNEAGRFSQLYVPITIT